MIDQASLQQLNGTVLGQYRLQDLLEQHPWGPSFVAENANRTLFVVRFIGLPITASEASQHAQEHLIYLGRFQQVANQVAALQQRHILPVLDYGNYRGTPYLVYPYIRTTSLRAQLASAGPLDLQTAGTMLEQVAEALSYAHEQAILHRNLSTLSIFLKKSRREGELFVSEFGLLQLYELSQPKSAGGLAFPGSSEGSAPEQIVQNTIDTYTDMYALGAVLYRMLTAHPPFEGQNREETARMHLYGEVPALRQWRRDLPSGLERIVTRALAKEPAQRFQHPSELVEEYWRACNITPSPRARQDTTGSLAKTARPIAAPNAWQNTEPQDLAPVQERPERRRSQKDAGRSRLDATASARKRRTRRRLITTIAAAAGTGTAVAAVAIGMGLFKPSTKGTTAQSVAPAAPTTAPKTPAKGANGAQPANGKGAAPGTGKTTTPANGQGTKPAPAANVLARKADIPLNSAKTFPIDGQKNPGVIVHLPDDRFVAFDSTCTHAGCSVSYVPQDHQLLCPCHDASFDPANKAAVTHGPAKQPLTAIPIRITADGAITR